MGRSENLGENTKLFSEIDKKSRLFQANVGATPRYRAIGNAEHVRLELPQRPMRPPPLNVEEFKAYRAIAKTLAPATILLNEQDEPVHLHGDLSPYIEMPSGQATFNIGNIIRPAFRTEFMALMLRARRDSVMISSQALRVSHHGDDWRFRILIQPFQDTRPHQETLLVSFPVVSAEISADVGNDDQETPSQSHREEELEHELASMREHLRTLVEEIETSNEELQSLNEELQSSNEELQSTNEEMETANEELQATNEELTTVNEELNIKTDEIRQSNAFLVSILENIDHPVLVTDRNLKILRYNRPAALLVGLESDQTKLSSETLYGELRLSKLLSSMAMRTIEKGTRNTRQIKNDSKWYKVLSQPYFDSRDAIVGAVLILDDITGPKETNERLKLQSRKLAELAGQQAATFNTMPVSIALLDADGVIVAVNDAWAQFGAENGIRPGLSFVGMNYIKVCEAAVKDPTDDVLTVARMLREILAGERSEFSVRYPCHSKGKQRWFRCSASVSKTGDEVSGIVVMHVDETSNVWLEKSLEEARKSAEDASNAKSLFLTTMSHELRTPLNAILGFSEMQKMQAYGPIGHDKYLEYSKDINSEANRLLALIDEILDLSKVESGKIEIAQSDFTFSSSLKSVFKLFEYQFRESGLKLQKSLASGLPMLRADEGMVRQMLVNLIGNAAKFTPPGGTIRVNVRVAGNGNFIIEVHDTGAGIPKHKLASITKPFEQVRSTFTTDNSGIGLGLAVVNSMMKLHGGTMKIDSELHIGTCVKLSFPPARVVTKMKAAKQTDPDLETL